MTTLIQALSADLDHHPIPTERLDDWAARYPALGSPAEQLLVQAACWNHDRADAVLVPLHRLAVDGDLDAARLIVVALAPRLATVARRQPYDRGEIRDELIGYLHEAAVTAHSGWTTRYSDQLVRAALRARRPRTSRPVTVVALSFDVPERTDHYARAESLATVGSILDRHAERGTISARTAASLYDVSAGVACPRPHGTRAADTARKRRQRDLARLRTAAPELRDELATAG